MVGAWWLVYSILTPFYHPYARLWLPLHAAGWLIAAGSIVALGPVAPPESPTSAGLGGRRHRAVVALGLAFLLACADRFGGEASAHLLPGLLGPTDAIRTTLVERKVLVEHLPSSARGATLRTLVRPAVAFYLDSRVAIRPRGDLGQLLREGRPGDWALVDEVLLRQEGDAGDARARLLALWDLEAAWPVPLSAPTLLDIDPGAAYGTSSVPTPTLMLLRRKPDEDGP
jgi:hypothetical protein